MSRSSYIKPYPVIASKKSGPHYVTISKVEKLGNEYTKDGDYGVMVTFESEDMVHQEIYWIGGYNYSKWLKLVKLLESTPASAMTDLLDKKIWIVIKHIIGESRKVKLVSVHINEPNVPLMIEEYE